MAGASSKNDNNSINREYDRIAHEYDDRWSHYVRTSRDKTLDRLDLKRSDRLLDVGCGSGALLQAISRQHPSIRATGLDLSRKMLDVARGKLNEQTALSIGEAQQLPFRSASFDVVVSCSSLHFWREPKGCIREIARVLKPTGRLVITDWCDDYIACRVFDLYLRVFDRAHFKTYGRSECIRLLHPSQFDNVRVDRYRIGWLWGMMTATASAVATE